MRSVLPLFIALFFVTPVVHAEDDPLVDRMAQLQTLFDGSPEGFEGWFEPSFLAAVPAPRLKALCKQIHGQFGKCTGVELVERTSAHAGVFEMRFEKGVTMPSTVTVQSAPPHRVVGWFIGTPMPTVKDLEGLVERMKKLPGKVGFAAARLTGEKPELLGKLNEDDPLAIGSAFKLYVLGAAVRAAQAGDFKWEGVIPVRKEWKSLPSGQTQGWPDGAPVTAHTLATLMISISDNTATDHLLFTLGRDKVEAAMADMGNRHAALNRPFLSTREMFLLKCDPSGNRAKTYLAREPASRREHLEKNVDTLPLEKADITVLSKPLHIDTLEWFASASDMIRAMDDLRRRGESDAGKKALEIMAVNRGLSISKKAWPYVGFKGGSEPGVLNVTFLLRSARGEWFAVAASWNDPSKEVEQGKFFGLVGKAIRLLEAAD